MTAFFIIVLLIWLGFMQLTINDLNEKNDFFTKKINAISKRLQEINSDLIKLYGNIQSTEKTQEDTTKPLNVPLKESISEPMAEILEEHNKITSQPKTELDEIKQELFSNIEEEKKEVQEFKNNFETKPYNNIPQKTTNKDDSFESVFMGNIFNKIGAITILIAICIFVKLISAYITISDEFKITMGFIAGIGMIIAAFKFQADTKLKNYSEVLMGTGFGAVLITIYCATSLMDLFNTTLATILASIVVAIIYLIADKQKTLSMLIIGLTGGYLNPFFVNTNTNVDFLFYYLIFLNLITIIFVFKNKDKQIINVVNLLMTFFTICCFSAYANESFSIVAMVVFFFLYICYYIISISNKEIN